MADLKDICLIYIQVSMEYIFHLFQKHIGGDLLLNIRLVQLKEWLKIVFDPLLAFHEKLEKFFEVPLGSEPY